MALVILLIFLMMENDGVHMAVVISGFVLVILSMIVLGISFGLIKEFTNDFVVPVMYLGRAKCVDGWRQFLSILSVNKCKFLLYVLFQIVIGMGIGGIILGLALFTCCCACCLMAIPYIGTVLLLPILVFSRSYSLIYLKQYGSAFDVFVKPEVVGEVPN